MDDKIKAGDLVIALAGNPNVGKSTIFNALTGLNQHTGNWTGKTVSGAFGRFEYNKKIYTVVDLPGTYSLNSHSSEECVAEQFIKDGNATKIIVVCDAGCLERNLILALQIIDITKNVIVCVNLIDEANKNGIHIDLNNLSLELGVPVISTVARRNEGIEDLKFAIDQSVEYNLNKKPMRNIDEYVTMAEEIASRVISVDKDLKRQSFQERVDRILTGKYTGYPIMLLLIMFIMWLTIKGANYPSEILWQCLFFVESKLSLMMDFLGAPWWLSGALIDGAYRMLAWVISVMLPPMAIFFPLFTLLEDLGYLPRIAFNLDRGFQCCKTCGKQALTMCMGLGCNAAGVVGCRIIDSERERNIALLTNSLMPCNGKFPTLLAIITIFFSGMAIMGRVWIITLLIVFAVMSTFFCSAILANKIFYGVPSSFILELPPYRAPQIGRVLVYSLKNRILSVLLRAVAVSIPAGLILWILANIQIGEIGLLTAISDFISPIGDFFGMDGVILLSFILALPANEIVLPIMIMIYTSSCTLSDYSSIIELKVLLEAHGWDIVSGICTLIFMMFHWPCSTTLLTIRKESGSWKIVALGAFLPTVYGLSLCALVNILSYILGLR